MLVSKGTMLRYPRFEIHDALEIKKSNGEVVVVECQQHIGEKTVRTIAMDATDGLSRGMQVIATGSPILMPMDATDGLSRGMQVIATGSPILMPVGDKVKGRLLNVVGEPIDGIGTLSKEGGYPIHNEAPKFDEFKTQQEVLYTGISKRFYIQELRLST